MIFYEDGCFISYQIAQYNFISQENAEQFLQLLKLVNNTSFEKETIKKIYWELGSPRYVNIEETKKTKKISYYKDEELKFEND